LTTFFFKRISVYRNIEPEIYKNIVMNILAINPLLGFGKEYNFVL